MHAHNGVQFYGRTQKFANAALICTMEKPFPPLLPPHLPALSLTLSLLCIQPSGLYTALLNFQNLCFSSQAHCISSCPLVLALLFKYFIFINSYLFHFCVLSLTHHPSFAANVCAVNILSDLNILSLHFLYNHFFSHTHMDF